MTSRTGIRYGAVGIALFAFYIAPLLPLILVTSTPVLFGEPPDQHLPLWYPPLVLWIAWFYAIAPVGAAYLAAHLAKQLPLLHGFIVGLLGALYSLVGVRGNTVLFHVAFAALVLSCGIFGGWLWNYRHRDRNVAL
jgi:hypothetical protein